MSKINLKLSDIEVSIEDETIIANELGAIGLSLIDSMVNARVNLVHMVDSDIAEDMQGDKPVTSHTIEPKINNIPDNIEMELYR